MSIALSPVFVARLVKSVASQPVFDEAQRVLDELGVPAEARYAVRFDSGNVRASITRWWENRQVPTSAPEGLSAEDAERLADLVVAKTQNGFRAALAREAGGE